MVTIRIHPHARVRMQERGVLDHEVAETVEGGQVFEAKMQRSGFRRTFGYNGEWLGKFYGNKQVEVIAVRERDGWLVLTAIARYF